MFYGVFERYGSKKNYKGNIERTVLLRDIQRGGAIITDHIWLRYTKGFDKLRDLNKGDIIQFFARVRIYLKGYGGFENKEIDYRLSHPTKIMLVKSRPKEVQNICSYSSQNTSN